MGVDFGTALAELQSGGTIKLEKRPKRYMFGCLNYGDMPGFRNDADGDPWDVFAPGYESTLPFRIYTSTGVLGALVLNNGNHKIAVTIDHPGYDHKRATAEIKRYCRMYCRRVGVAGRWMVMKPASDGRIQ